MNNGVIKQENVGETDLFQIYTNRKKRDLSMISNTSRE